MSNPPSQPTADALEAAKTDSSLPPSADAVEAAWRVLEFAIDDEKYKTPEVRTALEVILAIVGSYLDGSKSDAKVTRFEVIDWRANGGDPRRAFVSYDCRVDLSRQDGGRTLKVVVTDPALSTPGDANGQ